jgi:HIV type I enhancer-binding protein
MTTIRAPSPRRALYPNPPLSMGQYLQTEPIVLGPPVSIAWVLFTRAAEH